MISFAFATELYRSFFGGFGRNSRRKLGETAENGGCRKQDVTRVNAAWTRTA